MAHCDVSMATQWGLGSLHPNGKIRVFLSSKCYLLDLDVHSVGVSEYGYYTGTALAQGSLLDSGATKKAFFIWVGRGLVGSMLLW